MPNRLKGLFAQNDRFKLSLFFTAGYPKLVDTDQILIALEQGGVDFVEIRFPFSDLLADGPGSVGQSIPSLRAQWNEVGKFP